VDVDAGAMGKVAAGANATIVAKVGAACNLSFAVMSSTIQATGVGDNVGEWQFEKEETPLLGDQIMAHVILVPRYTRALHFEVQTTALATTSWWKDAPAMFRSDWIPLKCELPNYQQALRSAQFDIGVDADKPRTA
jgi:hypothetical protein